MNTTTPTTRHPMADLAIRLIREGAPGIHRVNVKTFALLMGWGRGERQRHRAWLKTCEDLLDDLHEEGILDKVSHEGEVLWGLRWPDLDDREPTTQAQPEPDGYAGPTRTPIRVLIAEPDTAPTGAPKG